MYTPRSYKSVEIRKGCVSCEWANKNGIVSGISNESFAPDQSITREQMAVYEQLFQNVGVPYSEERL